jgi:putative tryptophan/tyrosine transport system substrate-binding protein
MIKLPSFFLLAGLATLAPFLVHAQSAEKVHHVGILSGASDVPQFFDAFRQRLRELGHLEGKNIFFVHRYAAGDLNRLPDFAAQLIDEKVDLIVAVTTPAVVTAKKATTAIPIVMHNIPDPVGVGLVDSLASPGGNVTGTSSLGLDLSGKRLELLKETVPKLARVAVLWNAADRGMVMMSERIQAAAPPLGMSIKALAVRDAQDINAVLGETAKNRPDALYMIADRLTALHLNQVLDLAVKLRLPSVFEDGVFVNAGGLMAYGADRAEMNRRTAGYVDKILRGTPPRNLPVEQPMKFELAINLKTAKQISLTIPQNVLARADRVVK